MNKKELETKIRELEKKLENFELDPGNYEKQYDEALDEQGDILIGNLSYAPSYVLKEVDPTAYRIGLLDYIDSLDIEDDIDYKEFQDKLEELQDEYDNLG